MQKNIHGRILTTTIFASTILVIVMAFMILTIAADSDTFSVSATVTSDPPTVVVDASQSVTGSATTTNTVYITFNATDPNGGKDIDNSTASVTLSRAGNTDRTSSSCAVSVVNTTIVRPRIPSSFSVATSFPTRKSTYNTIALCFAILSPASRSSGVVVRGPCVNAMGK